MTLKFFFDFISPYAYAGWHDALRLEAERGLALEPVPVLFAALLDHHGQRGPAEIPAKRVYVFKDALRRAHQRGLPLVPPPAHPFVPLIALRVCGELKGEAQRRAITALFDVAWGGQRYGEGGLDHPEVVRAALDAVGLNGSALVASAADPAVKARLKQATADAVAHDVFGVPSFLVDGELFWGTDSLEHIARFLDGEDPVDAEALERWRDLPATATRPRSVR